MAQRFPDRRGTFADGENTRSFKAVEFPVNYRGKINLRGARTGAEGESPTAGRTGRDKPREQNNRGKTYSGKNFRTPKKFVVSGEPAGFGNSPSYSPGAYSRGMGHTPGGGYGEPKFFKVDGKLYNQRSSVDMRALRDMAAGKARTSTGLEEKRYREITRRARLICAQLDKENAK